MALETLLVSCDTQQFVCTRYYNSSNILDLCTTSFVNYYYFSDLRTTNFRTYSTKVLIVKQTNPVRAYFDSLDTK